MGWEEALEQLRVEEGGAFDPWLLDLFEAEIRKDPREGAEAGGVRIPSEGQLQGSVTEAADADAEPTPSTEQEWI